ncbi:168aa long hypothetical protein [Pyrococcus horikoshii OT3]|uniref:Uncharacterized protein n=1 Tax=Pyrococcus horikoshii (strain ATCC 700860 / DSM 12428 / JCM 9974 / NBRC 100139 / OT-3) TaxID=70601 RepID=O58182_PYRHO|nr:168aa long hypothetical protein [Pyrococcus horikoshii OT3]
MPTTSAPCLVTSTLSLILSPICLINSLMSSAAFLLSSANFLISSATTANPFPASPALAASIAAFNASKLVCSAMLLITFVMFSMFLPMSATPLTVSSIICIILLISSIWVAAILPFSPPSLASWAISLMEASNSSMVETVSLLMSLMYLMVSVILLMFSCSLWASALT